LPAARSPKTAAQPFVQALGSAVSCVTTRRLDVASDPDGANGDQWVFLAAPASLRAPASGPTGLFLHVRHDFKIFETGRHRPRSRLQVETRMYEYRLLDHDHEDLLVYHWQPGPDYAGPDHPHLHVSAALDAQLDATTRRSIDLDKLHLATGRVTLPTIIRMLITEFAIAPHRHDWRETLDRAEAVLLDEAPSRP
jgi:hypothetical protein